MRSLILQILYIVALSSCSPSPKELTEDGATQKNAVNATAAKSVGEVDAAPNAPSNKTPYLAIFKDADVALPEPVDSGIFSIVDGCVILTTVGSEGGVYTPVFGEGTSITYENGVPKSILDENKKAIPLGVKTNVPGANIGTNHNQYLAESLPIFCPRTLFGIGN